jgi:hypothetical protein
MKTYCSALIAMMLCFTPLIAEGEQDSTHSDLSGRISSEVSVFPSDLSGFWIGEATITDSVTGDVLATPKMTFKAGKEARMQTVIEPGGDAESRYGVDMRVLVSMGGDAAEYGLTISVGDDVVSEQAATLRLK